MRKIPVFLLFVLLSSGIFVVALAQNMPSVSQIERTNELLNAQDRLNKIIQTPRSYYIKDITLKVEGTCKMPALKEITESYKNKWLTENDIQEMIELLKHKCGRKASVSYRIKDNTLEIEIVDFKENLD